MAKPLLDPAPINSPVTDPNRYAVPAWTGFVTRLFAAIDFLLNGNPITSYQSNGADVTITQATLAAFTAKLTARDSGIQVWISDYAHLLRWTGSAWTWGYGDIGSGFVVAFATAGPSPATGWHAADATVGVHFLKSDGSLGTVTVPNTAGSFFRQ